jgi:IS5 family transposase
VPRVQRVLRQTKARIYKGDTRSAGKIVSIFEPSAEIIRKGKAAKPTEFGKLVKLQEAENQIIVDYEVYTQRPPDADLLIPAIDMHAAKLGRVPRLVAADAGFYSGQNQAMAKARGVKRVCIPNHGSKSASRKREQNFSPPAAPQRYGPGAVVWFRYSALSQGKYSRIPNRPCLLISGLL